MRSVNVTLRSIVVSFSNRTSKGDTVIVDRGAIGRRREIPTDSTNSERNESKPFDRANGEPLDVTERDGERENLSVFDVQINVHHVGGKLAGGMLGHGKADKAAELLAILAKTVWHFIYTCLPNAVEARTK
jgi:hypothetical protein